MLGHFRFLVTKKSYIKQVAGVQDVRLRRNSWDDYGYGTTFDLAIYHEDDWHAVGTVKIGSIGLRSSHELPDDIHTSFVQLPEAFDALTEEYFSLGQGSEYYKEILNVLGSARARDLLLALRDVAVTPGLADAVIDEDVFQTSLTRSMSARSFGQFAEIIGGVAQQRDFEMTYRLHPEDPDGPKMTFRVDRKRRLPSNVHVVIGSNGAGKTTALSSIRRAFEVQGQRASTVSSIALSDKQQIAGLLSVSFSAFDPFPPERRDGREQIEFRITNVRLPWLSAGTLDASSNREVEMGEYVREETLGCLAERAERLLPALQLLADADPVLDFHRVGTADGLDKLDYNALSSGHKIAILTIASLVRYVEDKTLVLLDEPESHLHPPLLGALTRALSNLLTATNGLALVATHSPVVLQEVPRRCAWIVWSTGGDVHVEQPTIETFGANLGVLTREVFDLELSKSGYHALLRDVAGEASSYDEAVGLLDNEIGDEAQVLLRSMIRRKKHANG